ncbi:alpha/beta hydrolase [Peribacillus glennii]|uniref:Alpha/beta fold hydrolase n=1 Tax=Peribacillus glennii TaxID=2303991 RepID=A0A372L7W3_9BACI|nr:alpha/beta fold hydrolase [Peribacillus glennii]RFU61055.1 alpha/beta fold hydrolase [Peribacillus glennii]
MNNTTVIPGAESYYLEGNSTGILICHGFNGTPQSVEYLGRKFAEHGFTVNSIRLKGHGTTLEEMESCNYHDWIKDVEDGFLLLKQTCSKVFVIGQSMGGALALDLAGKVDCDGVMTINAALNVPDYEHYRHLTAPRFIPEGKPDIKDPDAVEITYTQVPINAIHQLLSLMESTRGSLQKVKSPILLFHSPEDHVVPHECSYEIFHLVSSKVKSMVPLNNSYHVASLDYDRDIIIEAAIAFINSKNKDSLAS